jgi:hypothetical protein
MAAAAAACPIWAAWAFKSCPFKRTAKNKEAAFARPLFYKKILRPQFFKLQPLKLQSRKNVMGSGAALDDGSAQPVNIQMVMDHLQQT